MDSNTALKTGSPVDPSLPDSKKDEKYHKNYHDYLIGGRNAGYSAGGALDYYWDYYHGKVNPMRDHNHVIRSSSGELYPVDFVNYNKIMGFVEVMIGEAILNKQNITVSALSKGALAKKRKAIVTMETDFKLMPLYIEDQSQYGLPIINDDMAQSPADLEHKKKNYKEDGEIAYHRIIKHWEAKNKWAQFRELLYEDCFVGAKCFMESMTTPYGPKPKYRDPRTVVFDTGCQSPWGEDASFIGTVEYMPMHQVIQDFGLSEDDVKEIHNLRENNGAIQIGGSRVPHYLGGSGRTDMILVTDLQWKDTKRKKGLHFQSKAGTDHWHIKDEEAKIKGKPLEEKELPYEIVRRCTVIGGKKVVQWGELKNQVRSPDDWQKTGFTIQMYLPRWKNGRNVSHVQQLIPIQKTYDQTMYNIRMAYKRDRGKALLGDMAVLPDGYTLQDQAYYGEVIGIIPINTTVRGTGLQYNQFPTVDMTLPASTKIYLEIAQWLVHEMESITGISPARQGIPEAASQAVGVMDISRKQSLLRTQRFFSGFDIFTEKFFELVLGQYKIHMGFTEDGLENIIGDEGMRFIKSDEPWDLEDYGLHIKSSHGSDEDRGIVQEMLKFGAQNGMIKIEQALKFLMEDDPKEALHMLTAYSEEQEAAAMEEQQREREMQSQMQKEQLQANQQKGQQDAQAKMAMQKMNNDAKSQQVNKTVSSQERMNRQNLRSKSFLETFKAKEQAKNIPQRVGGK